MSRHCVVTWSKIGIQRKVFSSQVVCQDVPICNLDTTGRDHMMISENRKKDIVINEQREQIQGNRLSHIKELLKNVSS